MYQCQMRIPDELEQRIYDRAKQLGLSTRYMSPSKVTFAVISEMLEYVESAREKRVNRAERELQWKDKHIKDTDYLEKLREFFMEDRKLYPEDYPEEQHSYMHPSPEGGKDETR